MSGSHLESTLENTVVTAHTVRLQAEVARTQAFNLLTLASNHHTDMCQLLEDARHNEEAAINAYVYRPDPPSVANNAPPMPTAAAAAAAAPNTSYAFSSATQVPPRSQVDHIPTVTEGRGPPRIHLSAQQARLSGESDSPAVVPGLAAAAQMAHGMEPPDLLYWAFRNCTPDQISFARTLGRQALLDYVLSDERFWSQLPPYGTNPFAAFFGNHTPVPRLPSPPPRLQQLSGISTTQYRPDSFFESFRPVIFTGSSDPLPPNQQAVEDYFARVPTSRDPEGFDSDDHYIIQSCRDQM